MNTNKYPGYILQNPSSWTPNYKLFKDILGYFTPENSIVAVGLQDAKVSNVLRTDDNFRNVKEVQHYNLLKIPIPELEYVEVKYSTPFTIYKMPLSLYDYWLSSKISETLDFPKYATLIPKEVNIATLPERGLNIPTLINATNSTGDYSKVKVWILPHSNNKLPTVKVSCNLLSKAVRNDILDAGILN